MFSWVHVATTTSSALALTCTDTSDVHWHWLALALTPAAAASNPVSLKLTIYILRVEYLYQSKFKPLFRTEVHEFNPLCAHVWLAVSSVPSRYRAFFSCSWETKMCNIKNDWQYPNAYLVLLSGWYAFVCIGPGFKSYSSRRTRGLNHSRSPESAIDSAGWQ